MTRRRLTIARLMAIIILIALGLTACQKRMSELIREARLDDIRPMPIERLLSFLGNGTGSQAVSKR